MDSGSYELQDAEEGQSRRRRKTLLGKRWGSGNGKKGLVARIVTKLCLVVFKYKLLIAVGLTIVPWVAWMTALLFSSNQALMPLGLKQATELLIVVAHPDDESLFFAPGALAAYSRSSAKLSILVLSAGNNDGMGVQRQKELLGACAALGVDRKDRCVSLDVKELQDSPTAWWPEEAVAKQVAKYVKSWKVDAILTFDNGGVSGHVNHRAVSAGIRHLLTTTSTICVFENKSVNLLRKYSGLLDLPFTFFTYLPRLLFGWNMQTQHGLLVASPRMYLQGRRAFACHSSQFSWDRHLYLLLSRYMYYIEVIKV